MREGAARGCWTIFPGAQQMSKAGGPQALGCRQPSLSAKPSPDLEMGIHSALGQMSPERPPKPQLRSKSKGNGLQTKECCPPSRSRRSELLIFTAPWKEARTKARMRPAGLWGNWQNQISDNRYSQEKNFMNLGSYIFPYLQKRQNHLLKCLFLWLAATFYWDACVIALLSSAKSHWCPPYLLATVLRDLWESVSQVTIFTLAGIKISISFFDWLLITFLLTPIKLPTFSVAYWPFGGPLLWRICSVF